MGQEDVECRTAGVGGMPRGETIIVVGGGIGGLTAAYAIALQTDYNVKVLERADALHEVGAGIQMGPNAIKVLHRLGLGDTLGRILMSPSSLTLRSSETDAVLKETVFDESFQARFGFPYALCHRGQLQQCLIEACMAMPQISICTGEEVVAYKREHDFAVAVTSVGNQHTGAGVIAADGLWSIARKMLTGDDSAPRHSGHVAYRSLIPVERIPKDMRGNRVTVWGSKNTHMVFYPVCGGDRYNLVVSFPSDEIGEGYDNTGRKDLLDANYSKSCERVKKLQNKIDDWKMWAICDRDPIDNWGDGRIVLLGDAAHPMLPFLGQGACMAIEDGWVIADELSKQRTGVGDAFIAYQRRRRERTERTQLASRAQGRAYHQSSDRESQEDGAHSTEPTATIHDNSEWLYNFKI
jgi:3-hydroxybenzoate 6-monooxygenase